MAQSALRDISPTWWKDIKPQAPQKPVGQQMSDVLGGMALATAPIPVVGDVAGAVSDAAMYAAYPEERTMLNAGMSLAGLLPFVPGAGGVRAAEKAADALDMSQASKYKVTKWPSGRGYDAVGRNDLYLVKPSGNAFTIEYTPQWKSNVKPFQVQGGSIDEVVSLADQRLDRSYATQKGLAKYQSIPKAWTGEAKKIAKKVIDAGYDPTFSASTQSRSKYMEINGQKIRLSDHDLPLNYDRPDVDFRYGSDINALLSRFQPK